MLQCHGHRRTIGIQRKQVARNPVRLGQRDLVGYEELPAFSSCHEESILLFLCQAPNTRSRTFNDNPRHWLCLLRTKQK